MHQEDVPRFMGAKKVSMHQAGFQEVLMSAQLADEFPENITLIGVQPELLDDYGGSLRPCVKARIPDAVEAAVQVLQAWGVEAIPRDEPLAPEERVAPDELEIGAYERGRPD
jgi:hydrogenase maturation protease